MLTIDAMLAELRANPEKHAGFILQTRLNFHNIKQGELAREAEVGEDTISHIINGKTIARSETMEKIERALQRIIAKRPAHAA